MARRSFALRELKFEYQQLLGHATDQLIDFRIARDHKFNLDTSETKNMASLWKSKDCKEWTEHLENYYTEVSSLEKDNLLELERWFQEELPNQLNKQKKPFASADLIRLVTWKVGLRGKWRPRLLDFAKAANDKDIEEAYTKARTAVDGAKGDTDAEAIKQAMAALTALKGVGPATASALLQAMNPNFMAFMSDEAMLAALGSKDYTAAKGMELLKALKKKAAELTKLSGGEKGEKKKEEWSVAEVERCIFIHAALENKKSKKSKGGGGGGSVSSKKRKKGNIN
jgi:hypothetical protein